MSPQWSPNSSLIAFTSVRTGYFDIWLVNADDPTDLRNVTQTPTVYEDQPSWSPDGTQIIFRSSVSGAYELYSLPVPPPGPTAAAKSAPTPTQLTFDGKPKQQPDWGPVAGSAPGTATLTVSKRGHGRVRTASEGILCGPDCSATFVVRTVVEVRAAPAAGYLFDGWNGACGTTASTCLVRMNWSKSVVARFVKIGLAPSTWR